MASRLDDGAAPTPRSESCLDHPVDSPVEEFVRFTPSLLSPQHYDADSSQPISSGLCSLEELLSWQRGDASPFNVATVSLAPRHTPLAASQQRTLVSHDMMGGYLDDRFIQGSQSEVPFSFYHWNHIDIFNYFSHRLVTLPPAVWTNAAHRHGVPVLGTFITEWTEGSEICERFLKDEDSYRSVADKLVQISHWYRFDGWLINIENVLSEVAVRNVPRFLRYLTDQMHHRVIGSLVLWYDSVVDSGQLHWQNELNQSNRMFFEACDGIFTNYNWKEQNLEGMGSFSGLGGRHADVYVGVDVFGRGDVVGAMFDTNKALEVIRRFNFSAAIFAPGWVYEAHEDKKQFRRNQDRFWALLSPFLHVHRLTSPLPLTSSFCQGFGTALHRRGQSSSSSSWFHLSAQELQPLYEAASWGGRGWLSVRGCPDDVWDGGSSLLLEGLIAADHAHICARVFSLHVPLPSKILVVVVFKASEGVRLSLQLQTADPPLCTPVRVTEVQELADGPPLRKHLSRLCGPPDLNGWTLRCAEVELGGCVLREVCVKLARVGGPGEDVVFCCRVGEVKLLDVSCLGEPSQPVGGLCIEHVVWLRGAGDPPSPRLRLNANLRWEYLGGLVRHFRVYWRHLRGPDPRSPPGQMELVGHAHCSLFRVTGLGVPDPPGLLELLVEPVLREGLLVPESHWGRRSLSYSQEVQQ